MQLPGFPEPIDEYVYKLGMVRYPPWKYSCRASADKSIHSAKYNFTLVEQAYSSQVTIAIVIILVSLWGLLYSLISSVYNIFELHSKKKMGTLYLTDAQVALIDPSLVSDMVQLSMLGSFLLFLGLFLLGLIATIVVGVQYENVDALEVWFRDSIACAESADYFVGYLTQYTQFFQEIIRTTLICILVCVVMLSLDILYFVWRLHKGYLASQKLQDMFPEMLSAKNSDE